MGIWPQALRLTCICALAAVQACSVDVDSGVPGHSKDAGAAASGAASGSGGTSAATAGRAGAAAGGTATAVAGKGAGTGGVQAGVTGAGSGGHDGSAGAAGADCTPAEGRGPMLIAIAGGTFTESYTTPRVVTVDAFAIDATEVTAAQYRECVRAGCCPESPGFDDGCNYASARNDHPMNCLMQWMAEAYCAWAGKRLPTAQEWELAARGPDPVRKFPWGDAAPTQQHLNLCGQECAPDSPYPWNDGYAKTAPVGLFPEGATPEGVQDMSGNVSEWTAFAQCRKTQSACTDCQPEEMCETPCNPCGRNNNERNYEVKGAMYGDRIETEFMGYAVRTLDKTLRSESVGFRCAR